MNCNGMHCQGCGHGGGAAGAVVALVVIVALALRKAWPAIVSAVEITAWTVAALAGAALVTTGGVLAVRAARRRARRAATGRRSGVVVEGTRLYPPLPPAAPAALGPPRPADGRAWPLPGWWDEIRPRTEGDDDEHRR